MDTGRVRTADGIPSRINILFHAARQRADCRAVHIVRNRRNCRFVAGRGGRETRFNNIYLQGAFLIGFVLITAVLTIPALEGIFSVTSLSITQLLTVYGLAILNIPVIQCIKAIRFGIK